MSQIYDVAVIGLGAMGSATLYQMAKRGVNVIGIDQFSPPHNKGSTHGETRVTRRAIGEGIQYSPLAIRSHEIWKELATETGEQLLFEVGALMISEQENRSGVHGSEDFIGTTVAAAKQYDIPYEILDGEEISKRFPGFAASDTDMAYYEPGAGYLKVEECVATQIRRAGELGAKTKLNTKVNSVTDKEHFIELQTSAGLIQAKEIVVCAGPWIVELLGDPLGSILKQTRQVLHWYPIKAEKQKHWENFPVFIWLHDETEGYYGLPSLADPTRVKVADAGYGQETDPNNVERSVSDEEQKQMYENHVQHRLVGAELKDAKSLTCIYTVTPDNDFIIDKLPNNQRITVVSACSGHGFKHSAAIGEAVSQWVIDGETEIDLSAFKLDRF